MAVAGRALELARQPCYRWLRPPVTSAEIAGTDRATAWRICTIDGWWGVFNKKRGKNGKRPGPPAHGDLVHRDFTAVRPNALWLSDITEHATSEGKLYLCAIKDVYSNGREERIGDVWTRDSRTPSRASHQPES